MGRDLLCPRNEPLRKHGAQERSEKTQVRRLGGGGGGWEGPRCDPEKLGSWGTGHMSARHLFKMQVLINSSEGLENVRF